MSRIMAFGYDTTTSPFNRSTAIISDIAKQLRSHLINKRKTESVSALTPLEDGGVWTMPNNTPQQKQRPIIFVAHSLGGIVVKEVSQE